MKTIEYKGIKIAENTEAYLLWYNNKHKELDEHLKMLEAKRKKLEGQ